MNQPTLNQGSDVAKDDNIISAQLIAFVRQHSMNAAPELFACGICGQVYSPMKYGGGPKAIENARQAAADCSVCKMTTATDNDLERKDEETRRKRIAAATEVTTLEFCFSDREFDVAYANPTDALDAGETGVFGARFIPYAINIEALIDSITENHHDDASIDEMSGVDELVKACEKFNSQQNRGSYTMDSTRWQRLPQQQTFAMIKPDATARGIEAAMMEDIRAAGFTIVEEKRGVLTRQEAEWLYQEHAQKGHFNDLVEYTMSGEVVMMIISGEDDDVPAAFRRLMGPTDRTTAEPHTLRAKYAVGLRENSIHGSDSPSAAIDEIIYFMS